MACMDWVVVLDSNRHSCLPTNIPLLTLPYHHFAGCHLTVPVLSRFISGAERVSGMPSPEWQPMQSGHGQQVRQGRAWLARNRVLHHGEKEEHTDKFPCLNNHPLCIFVSGRWFVSLQWSPSRPSPSSYPDSPWCYRRSTNNCIQWNVSWASRADSFLCCNTRNFWAISSSRLGGVLWISGSVQDLSLDLCWH